MASYMIHMYIGEQYAKKNRIKDIEFLKGCLALDFVKDKKISHYRKNNEVDKYTETLKDKADLFAFCKNNKIDSPFKLGEFLHLVVDYEFYSVYLYNLKSVKKLDFVPIDQAKKEMDAEYDRINSLFVKYLTVEHLELVPDECRVFSKDKFKLCSKKGLFKVFNKCINMDLKKLYKQILLEK